jgi:twitching motility two-component system response regulator PilH
MKVRKILIVDDSRTEQQILRQLLSSKGYRCVAADNGEEAVAMAKSDQPDLILMDVVMPGMNGFQATRQIVHDEATRHIPIIMLSSKGEETDKVWGIRQGARAYLTKPVDPAELLTRIANIESD